MHGLKRLVVVLGLVVATGVLNAQAVAQTSNVTVPEELVTRLVVSEGLREWTSLWKERIHWRLLVIPYEAANTEYWKSIKSAKGKQSLVVAWSYPAGFDDSGLTQAKIDYTGELLLIFTEGSLKTYALDDRYIVSVLYAGGNLR